LLRLIFGADPKDAGNIYLRAAGVPAHIDSPPRAVSHGVGLVPEDRKAQGLLLTQSVTANITLSDLPAVSRSGWVDPAREKSIVERWLRQLRIRAHDGNQRVGELSGGNQQKVLLARWMHRDSDILLLDEPTRGVDVGARAELYRWIDVLARQEGKAVLVASSHLPELLGLADRIAVLCRGVLGEGRPVAEWSEHELMLAMTPRRSA
jgi:ribose transport system ATP-binding protein